MKPYSVRLGSNSLDPDTTEALKAAAEIMEWLKDSWGAHNARDSDVPYVADAFNAFAARKVAEAVAAERERIARRVSEHQILRFQVGRDPLVEVNEIIQDLAYDIATDWALIDSEGQTPCLPALASGAACQPDESLKRCAICGFVVDTNFAAEKPTVRMRP